MSELKKIIKERREANMLVNRHEKYAQKEYRDARGMKKKKRNALSKMSKTIKKESIDNIAGRTKRKEKS